LQVKRPSFYRGFYSLIFPFTIIVLAIITVTPTSLIFAMIISSKPVFRDVDLSKTIDHNLYIAISEFEGRTGDHSLSFKSGKAIFSFINLDGVTTVTKVNIQ